VILGASFDSPEENRAFKDKFNFPYDLLCDTGKSMGIAYGAAADASASHPAYDSWRAVAAQQDGLNTVCNVFMCTGGVLAWDKLSLELYREMGALTGASYRNSKAAGQCYNLTDWSGEANDQWDDCRDWVDANFTAISTGDPTPGEAGAQWLVVVKVAGHVVMVILGWLFGEWWARQQAKDLICGSSASSA